MAYYLGIDTSNYTTSCAIYDSEKNSFVMKKKLLPVKEGELGLRQSEAVFHHTVQLPELMDELFCDFDGEISAVGVSDAPRRAEGSYMPCFLVGVNSARCIASSTNKPVYKFSHQQGHIAAALYSAKREELFGQRFIAFHVSGGTTEALLVSENLDAVEIARSLDLKAGQAVDRVGVKLGYPFPAGKYVDSLAGKSEKNYKFNIKLKDGCCSLSGVQNKCEKMIADGEKAEDVCRYCLQYVAASLEAVALEAKQKYGELPVIFSGGVSSSRVIRERLESSLSASFAEPEFSCDNAAGVALLACKRNENQ